MQFIDMQHIGNETLFILDTGFLSFDNVKIKVPWYGYVVFILAILLFSGVFSSSDGILRALDFNVLSGSFGQIPTDKAMSFRGAGGSGAKDGFLFALELIPAVILALGIVNVIDGLGGLKAAQKIMNPLLKPLPAAVPILSLNSLITNPSCAESLLCIYFGIVMVNPLK